LDEELQAFDAYAAAAGVPLEDGSSLRLFFPLLGALTTSQLPRIHLPPVSEVLGAGCASPPQVTEEMKEEHVLEVGLKEDSKDLALASSPPHEDEVQPDLATVVQKYAHLFKDYPHLFIPHVETLPQHQAVVTLALTEAKRSATTEKGDRWCHTPDSLNLIREAGLRGRIPMGVDCKASIPKAGLYSWMAQSFLKMSPLSFQNYLSQKKSETTVELSSVSS